MSRVINVSRRDDGLGWVTLTLSDQDGYRERIGADRVEPCTVCGEPVEPAPINYQLEGEWCHSWCLPPEVTSSPKFPGLG
jgi:hypothetical protein